MTLMVMICHKPLMRCREMKIVQGSITISSYLKKKFADTFCLWHFQDSELRHDTLLIRWHCRLKTISDIHLLNFSIHATGTRECIGNGGNMTVNEGQLYQINMLLRATYKPQIAPRVADTLFQGCPLRQDMHCESCFSTSSMYRAD